MTTHNALREDALDEDALDEGFTAWVKIPDALEKAIEGLTDDDLNLRGGSHDWSIRETAHHLVEANLVLSNIVIAAVAKTGCTYDWSWLTPDRPWMERMGYHRAPVGPAINTLKALCGYISGLVGSSREARGREIKLLDAPGAELRVMTVEELIREEVQHSRDHLRDVAATRKHHAR